MEGKRREVLRKKENKSGKKRREERGRFCRPALGHGGPLVLPQSGSRCPQAHVFDNECFWLGQQLQDSFHPDRWVGQEMMGRGRRESKSLTEPTRTTTTQRVEGALQGGGAKGARIGDATTQPCGLS